VENFLSEIGPWTALGPTALTTDAYVPDFDAEVREAAFTSGITSFIVCPPVPMKAPPSPPTPTYPTLTPR
jgi:hypothetical protein